MQAPKNVDEYIANAPPVAQEKLRQLRKLVKEVVPSAEEKISYGMPYYSLNGRLLYFAYFKNHISLFALPSTVKWFEKEIQPYHRSKATVGFSYDKPLPLSLIKKMIEYRVKENQSKKK